MPSSRRDYIRAWVCHSRNLLNVNRFYPCLMIGTFSIRSMSCAREFDRLIYAYKTSSQKKSMRLQIKLLFLPGKRNQKYEKRSKSHQKCYLVDKGLSEYPEINAVEHCPQSPALQFVRNH